MTEFDRDAIVDNALELLINPGYNSTTVADIAAANGLEPDALAAAFPNTESFVFAVVDAMLAAVFEALAEADEADDLVEALRGAHQRVLNRIIAGEGPVPLTRMQRMGLIMMTYPVVAQKVSARRKRMLALGLAQQSGVRDDDPQIVRAVTLWSAVVAGTYAAGINDEVVASPQADLIETDRMRGRLGRTFTQVTGKRPS